MSSNVRGIRDSIRSLVPIWLQNRPGFQIGFSFLYVWGLVLDVIRKFCIEGVYTWWPGFSLGAAPNQVDASTALPLIGQSRGILQGPGEPDATYAARLVRWLDDAERAGSAEVLAQEIQAYLIGAGTLGAGVLPTVRVVDRGGNWVIANPDGSLTSTSSAWDWDEVGGWIDGVGFHAPDAVEGYWSDLWVIIAPDPFTRYTSTSDPAWLAVAGQGPNVPFGLGHQVPREYVDGILAIIDQRKGAHVWVRAIIWAGDTTSFSPGTPTADGTFGDASKVVAGVEVGARDPNARYWHPPTG